MLDLRCTLSRKINDNTRLAKNKILNFEMLFSLFKVLQNTEELSRFD